MPLRDHFRPPLDDQLTWVEFHGQWPGRIVQQLRTILPPGYVAGPTVHPGSHIEVDIAAFENDDRPAWSNADRSGGVPTAAWTMAEPNVAVETDLTEFDEYEVHIYDAKRGRKLVAAIEIVSPANKDRPEHRAMFLGKCAGLLRQGVAVSIVDLVTVRDNNLYLDLLEMIGHTDPTLGTPNLYATSSRWLVQGKKTILQSWSNAMVVGQPLPVLPLWLTKDFAVSLDLEESYENTCHDLWIT